MNGHRAVSHRLQWMQHAFGLDSSDAVLQKTTVAFDVSVWELFWPLIVGARLVFAGPRDHQDPARLVELIAQHRITTMHSVPSMLGPFLRGADEHSCRSLAQLICSGEALTAELRDAALPRLPGTALYNLYGPTECAVDVTWWRCRAPRRGPVVPIGRPIANTTTYVLDRGLQLVPTGAIGELYLGGIQVGRGYLGRPGLTAERFVPDPFGAAGGRLYRTGDQVRWNTQGELEFLGRVDHQVKVRGYRIELGEVESALSSHPSVGQCAVVAQGRGSTARLVAYLVPAEERAVPDVAALRAHLSVALPDYMLPSAFVPLEALPLTPNGKLDRRALPEPGSERPELGATPVAPRTPTEAQLAAAFCEVLGLDSVGVHDDFFALGGHSLLATQLVSRLREGLGRGLALRWVFEAPTVAGLAARLAASDGVQGLGPPPLQRVVPRPSVLPLSFGQQRLWFLQRLEPDSPAYNMPVALRLTGDLDVDALSASTLRPWWRATRCCAPDWSPTTASRPSTSTPHWRSGRCRWWR